MRTLFFLLSLLISCIQSYSAPFPLPGQNRGYVDLIQDCHAVGDGAADDTDAMRNCINIALSTAKQLGHSILHIPSGRFLFRKNDKPFPTMDSAISIVGDGPSSSTLLIDGSFTGDLFSWSETWIKDSFARSEPDVKMNTSGVLVSGLKVVGLNRSPTHQAALAFYDRNDFVIIRDVEIYNLNGPCLTVGRALKTTQAYLRESSITNLKCWFSGNHDEAAVNISSATTPGSDATNEVDIHGLALFSSLNVGLSISNPHAYSATRKVRFFDLRVEQSGGSNIEINSTGDKGQVSEISFYNVSSLGSADYAMKLGNSGGTQLYAVAIRGGLFGPNNKKGIRIENGRMITIDLSGIDAPIVLGDVVGLDIDLRGDGSEYAWKFQGTKMSGEEAKPLNLRSLYGLYGIPSAGARIGSAALKGEASGQQSARLTMDGRPADPYNCFNPGYAEMYNLDISIIAVNRRDPGIFFGWQMPMVIFSAWTGAASAKLVSGPASAQGVSTGRIDIKPDNINGCIALVFTPPIGNHDTWDVTAAIRFARAP